MAIGRIRAMTVGRTETLEHLKAAQSNLQLNGHNGLPMWDTPLLNFPPCLLLIRVPGPAGKPNGTRLIAPGKAMASPLFGPQLLNRVLVTVALFREFGH